MLCWILAPAAAANGKSEQQRPTSAFAQIDGVRVHYESAGTGAAALVFVHGWTCRGDFWERNAAAFPEYRTIAIDLPGHGRSDKPRTNYTLEYFARSIDAVLRDANIDRAVLVGHSMGAAVIHRFYQRHPEKTLALVIVDGSLVPLTEAGVLPVARSLRANYGETAAKLVDSMLQAVHDPRLARKIRDAMLATPDYVGVSALQGMADDTGTNRLIAVPVLAILADVSAWTPDIETSFRAVAPRLSFHMWHGVSHFLMMERPGEFNDDLRSFILSNGLLRRQLAESTSSRPTAFSTRARTQSARCLATT